MADLSKVINRVYWYWTNPWVSKKARIDTPPLPDWDLVDYFSGLVIWAFCVTVVPIAINFFYSLPHIAFGYGYNFYKDRGYTYNGFSKEFNFDGLMDYVYFLGTLIVGALPATVYFIFGFVIGVAIDLGELMWRVVANTWMTFWSCLASTIDYCSPEGYQYLLSYDLNATAADSWNANRSLLEKYGWGLLGWLPTGLIVGLGCGLFVFTLLLLWEAACVFCLTVSVAVSKVLNLERGDYGWDEAVRKNNWNNITAKKFPLQIGIVLGSIIGVTVGWFFATIIVNPFIVALRFIVTLMNRAMPLGWRSLVNLEFELPGRFDQSGVEYKYFQPSSVSQDESWGKVLTFCGNVISYLIGFAIGIGPALIFSTVTFAIRFFIIHPVYGLIAGLCTGVTYCLNDENDGPISFTVNAYWIEFFDLDKYSVSGRIFIIPFGLFVVFGFVVSLIPNFFILSYHFWPRCAEIFWTFFKAFFVLSSSTDNIFSKPFSDLTGRNFLLKACDFSARFIGCVVGTMVGYIVGSLVMSLRVIMTSTNPILGAAEKWEAIDLKNNADYKHAGYFFLGVVLAILPTIGAIILVASGRWFTNSCKSFARIFCTIFDSVSPWQIGFNIDNKDLRSPGRKYGLGILGLLVGVGLGAVVWLPMFGLAVAWYVAVAIVKSFISVTALSFPNGNEPSPEMQIWAAKPITNNNANVLHNFVTKLEFYLGYLFGGIVGGSIGFVCSCLIYAFRFVISIANCSLHVDEEFWSGLKTTWDGFSYLGAVNQDVAIDIKGAPAVVDGVVAERYPAMTILAKALQVASKVIGFIISLPLDCAVVFLFCLLWNSIKAFWRMFVSCILAAWGGLEDQKEGAWKNRYPFWSYFFDNNISIWEKGILGVFFNTILGGNSVGFVLGSCIGLVVFVGRCVVDIVVTLARTVVTMVTWALPETYGASQSLDANVDAAGQKFDLSNRPGLGNDAAISSSLVNVIGLGVGCLLGGAFGLMIGAVVVGWRTFVTLWKYSVVRGEVAVADQSSSCWNFSTANSLKRDLTISELWEQNPWYQAPVKIVQRLLGYLIGSLLFVVLGIFPILYNMGLGFFNMLGSWANVGLQLDPVSVNPDGIRLLGCFQMRGLFDGLTNDHSKWYQILMGGFIGYIAGFFIGAIGALVARIIIPLSKYCFLGVVGFALDLVNIVATITVILPLIHYLWMNSGDKERFGTLESGYKASEGGKVYGAIGDNRPEAHSFDKRVTQAFKDLFSSLDSWGEFSGAMVSKGDGTGQSSSRWWIRFFFPVTQDSYCSTEEKILDKVWKAYQASNNKENFFKVNDKGRSLDCLDHVIDRELPCEQTSCCYDRDDVFMAQKMEKVREIIRAKVCSHTGQPYQARSDGGKSGFASSNEHVAAESKDSSTDSTHLLPAAHTRNAVEMTTVIHRTANWARFWEGVKEGVDVAQNASGPELTGATKA